MARTGWFPLAVLVISLSAGSALGKSDDEYMSPAVAKETRRYIFGAIGELESRAEKLRQVIEYKEAACKVLREVPSESGGYGCGPIDSRLEAGKKIALALGLLEKARDEGERQDFDAAQQRLGDAQRELFAVRKLLASSE